MRYAITRCQSNIAYVLLVLALLYLCALAVFSGFSYVNQYRLDTKLNRWYEQGSPPSVDAWMTMEEMALFYLSFNQKNADAVNALGRLYDYRSAFMASTVNEQHRYEHKAATYYRQVTRLRPAWPYGWLNFAGSKARLGEVDGEFKYALLQLLRTGAWEKNTLPAIIQLALFAWSEMNHKSQQSFIDYFIIAQAQRGKDVYRTLTTAAQRTMYCSIVDQYVNKPSFCQHLKVK